MDTGMCTGASSRIECGSDSAGLPAGSGGERRRPVVGAVPDAVREYHVARLPAYM